MVIVNNNEIGLNNCNKICPREKRARTHTETRFNRMNDNQQANRMRSEKKPCECAEFIYIHL